MKRFAFFAAAALSLVGTLGASSCCSSNCYAYPEHYLFDGCFCPPEGKVYVYGDWLLWNPRRCNLDFAVQAITFFEGDETSNYISVEPDYNSGFRVGLGFRACEGWDIGARYTHFSPEASSSVSTNGDASFQFFATRLHSSSPGVNNFYSFASSTYKLDYDVIDIELGGWREVGCDTAVKGFLGVKLAWWEEELDTFYGELEGLNAEAKETHDFKGFGLSLGLAGHKDVWCHLGLFGRTSVAILVSDSKVVHVDGEQNFDVIRADVHDTCHSLASTFELAFGLDYSLSSLCGFTSMLGIGYEFHEWYNVADFITFTGSNQTDRARRSRNLAQMGYDGLFVRLGAAF